MFDFNNPMSRGTSYPFGNGLDMSKLQPNPAAQARKPAAVDATAEGIAQVKRAMKLPAGVASSYNKKKTNCDPGEVSSRGVCKKKGRKKKASQDNSGQRLSSAGEESGVKYKIDADGDKTGRSAFDTLDNYMKKAGLNSFQSSFFSRMVLEGANIEGAIKQAEDRFGEKVASELKSGFETLEKQANPLIKSLLSGAGKFFSRKGIQEGIKKAPAVAKQIARKPGVAAQATGRSAVEGGKKFLTGTGAGKQMAQGASVGAFNPVTGLMSNQAFDEQGNVRFGHLAQQALLGAAGRRGLGMAPVGQAGINAGVRRAMAGSGAGYTGGVLGQAAGMNVDPTTMAQLGFAGGAAMTPRAQFAATKNLPAGKVKDFLRRPLGQFNPGAGKRLDALSAADPVGALLTGGSAAAGKYLKPGVQAAGKSFNKLNPNAKALLAGAGGAGATGMYLGNKMDQQANQFRQDLQPYLDGAAQTMNRTNEFMDNPVGGLLGGLGDTFKENPWLLPLLLGGGGAALGGMAGGGTGATLGGIGLPLLYMMSQGKGLGDLFPGGQQNVAQTQQQMANQDESTRAAQQAQNPVATQNTDQQDEFARQGAQQFAEANPGMMDGGMFDFTGYGQDEMAQLFAKASPQQQRILQDPSIPEATKGQILEQIAQG